MESQPRAAAGRLPCAAAGKLPRAAARRLPHAATMERLPCAAAQASNPLCEQWVSGAALLCTFAAKGLLSLGI
eukprot:1150797-Pelagomonas_calceolata.AAC.3